MPLYEYRCRTCDTTFEEQRPMSQSSDPATCPDGHGDARRVLSVFMSSVKSSGSSSPAPMSMPMGGGGCGSGCGCH